MHFELFKGDTDFVLIEILFSFLSFFILIIIIYKLIENKSGKSELFFGGLKKLIIGLILLSSGLISYIIGFFINSFLYDNISFIIIFIGGISGTGLLLIGGMEFLYSNKKTIRFGNYLYLFVLFILLTCYGVFRYYGGEIIDQKTSNFIMYLIITIGIGAILKMFEGKNLAKEEAPNYKYSSNK